MKKNRKKRMGLVRLCIWTIGLLIGNGNLWASRAYSLPSVPDSAYLFSYTTKKNSNHSELYFAWSLDTVNWQGIGPEHGFLFCDYGRWGNEKRMLDPYLCRSTDGIWHCLWRVNEREAVVAHAASNDLIRWKWQSYRTFVKTQLASSGNPWKKKKATLVATASSDSVVLGVCPLTAGTFHLDLISVFPREMFKGRANGLCADLALAITDIHPRIVRFPVSLPAYSFTVICIKTSDR